MSKDIYVKVIPENTSSSEAFQIGWEEGVKYGRENYTELIESIKSVVWYNCLYEELGKLKRDIKLVIKGNYHMPEFYKEAVKNNSQYEFIWIMLVEMFGNCGTSPRSGWIDAEKKNDAAVFIDSIIKFDDENYMTDNC